MTFVNHIVAIRVELRIGVSLYEGDDFARPVAHDKELTIIIITSTNNRTLTNVNVVEVNFEISVLESSIGDGRWLNLLVAHLPRRLKLNDNIEFWDHSGSTKLRELSLFHTVVNIGYLGLNEITVVEIERCSRDVTKRNSALHVLIDKIL